VAANHHNALVDGVLLLGHFPRRLVSVAKAPLFSNPLIGPFLRLIGALPVHRRQEGGTDPARNTALFEASSGAIKALVVDPRQGYFWLSCATAMNSENPDRAIPPQSRRLVRVHACLHRH